MIIGVYQYSTYCILLNKFLPYQIFFIFLLEARVQRKEAGGIVKVKGVGESGKTSWPGQNSD